MSKEFASVDVTAMGNVLEIARLHRADAWAMYLIQERISVSAWAIVPANKGCALANVAATDNVLAIAPQCRADVSQGVINSKRGGQSPVLH